MSSGTLDLDNFMDVITSYKCKFCSFTCQFRQGIASHVKNVHLPQNVEVSSDRHPVKGEQTVQEVSMVNVAVIDEIPKVSQQQGIILQKQENDLGSLPTQTFTETLVPNVSTVEEAEIEQQSVPDIASRYAEIVQEATGTIVSEAPSTMVSEASTQSSVEVSQAAGSLETVEEDDAKGQKELFLCGQCGGAFSSIEDCKQHMVDEHNIMLPAEGFDVALSTAETATHMDASTQVAPKKKPGRKRKVKEPQQIMINPKLRTPEDEEPPVELENIGKRRIKLPSALKDDYFLSKRMKVRRKTRELNKPFDLKCKILNCLAQFQLSSSLKIHEECHNPDMEKGGFICPKCSQFFTQWRTIRMHLWRDHKVDTDLFTCDAPDCHFKTDKTYKMNVHKEIHSGHHPYKCDQCSRSFKQLNQLKNHQIIHIDPSAETSDRWYKSKECKICTRAFANAKCLNKHIETVHSKIKPYICHFCGHTASRKAMLQLHLRTHTGEKPFKCDHCDYMTGDHNSLRRHRMRHTGQKPYACQFCEYTSIQSIGLKTHMKNKHPGLVGVHACHLCTYISVNKSSLEHHLEDHKNGLIEIPPPGQSGHPKPATVGAPPVTASMSQPSQSQTFQVKQSQDEAPQQVTVTTPLNLEGGIQSIISNDLSAAQLIYSALSAIQQSQKGRTSEAITIDGMQATVADNSNSDGSAHTITFHIPSSQSTITNSDNQILLAVQPQVSEGKTNSQDAISAVAYNTNNQSTLGVANEGSGTENREESGNTIVYESNSQSGVLNHTSTDLLNHAATMMALRGDQEIVSLAAETANLPMRTESEEEVVEAQLVQIRPVGGEGVHQLVQNDGQTQFVQVVSSDADVSSGQTVLQLGGSDAQILQVDASNILQAVSSAPEGRIETPDTLEEAQTASQGNENAQ